MAGDGEACPRQGVTAMPLEGDARWTKWPLLAPVAPPGSAEE